MAFKNRIRLPFMLGKAQFPSERNVFRKADGSTMLLSAIIRNTYEGQTDDLPEDWHRKLTIALHHDEVTIEDRRLLTDVIIAGDYSIDWKDFLNHPTAQAKFTVQVTPFDATNNNCATCTDVTQLNLVDDTTDEVWEEGTTHDYPVSVLDNDYICCYPFVVDLISWNTDYFTDVQLAQDGTLTATLKAETPTINNLLLATYRVTCENGGYDEANVYVNIDGTSDECLPPSGLQVIDDDTIATLSWTAAANVPAGGYDWNLYLSSNLVTPVQSGNTATLSVDLTGLTPGESYVFTVSSNCGGGNSTTIQIQWAQNIIEPGSCARFLIHLNAPGATVNISYMDCELEIKSEGVNSIAPITRCMRIVPGGTVPIFFASSAPSTTIEYITLC